VMHTSQRRETGRPRAAQFAARAVYIPGGGPRWCGREGARDRRPRARPGHRWRGARGLT
jgi:hypothetical protein